MLEGLPELNDRPQGCSGKMLMRAVLRDCSGRGLRHRPPRLPLKLATLLTAALVDAAPGTHKQTLCLTLTQLPIFFMNTPSQNSFYNTTYALKLKWHQSTAVSTSARELI